VLPIIRTSLDCGFASIQWVVTVFLLVVSALLLTFGRLGDLKGHAPVYIAGLAVFAVGGTLCGIARSVDILILFRGVQAVGAAMLFATSPAILIRIFPPEQRGRALGLQSMLVYLGLTVGPSIGGWLTGRFGWRAVFLINLPLGLISIVMSLRFLPRHEPQHRGERLDLAGMTIFAAGLTALMLALNQGHAWGWGSVRVVGLLVGATVLGIGFWAIERRVAAPLLDLSLFRNRLFTLAGLSAIANYVAIYAIIFLMPFYLIQGRGMGAARTGLILTAQPLLMAIAAPISGILSDRIGSRLPGTAGMAVLALGLWLLSRLGADAPTASIVLALAVAGLGTGIFISPNSSALMGAAPRERQGIAGGVLATARNFGMVLGVGLAGAVYSTLVATEGVIVATRGSFLAAAGVALAGALVSASRGSVSTRG
jgi:EmrB/QacA subfamily drug resistance transporter